MERNWERTLPFFYINRDIVNNLFRGLVDKEDILRIKPVDEGCRTSNYIIDTSNDKKYILKIFFSQEQDYKKEHEILKIIRNKVPVQEICKFDKDDIIENKYYAIYKYVEGTTLSRSLQNTDIVGKSIIKDAASALAEIHRIKFKSIGFFDENLNITVKLKPLDQWYGDFINEKAGERLGRELIEKIRILVDKSREELVNLDNDPRLVHGDFQGTNILIKENRISGIIDWEFSMAGHPLADIGQFFRYDEYFNEESISIFEEEYRKKSDYILPENWYELSKVRDMVNLIQLLGFKEEMPNRYREIKSLIMKTINRC